MPENPAIKRHLFHSWRAYISLLFLGFFPGAFLMHAQQEEKPTPVILEYDVMILRVPAAADVSKFPDFSDLNSSATSRPLYEQGWRKLREPKLMSSYPGDITCYLGPIPGLDGNSLTQTKIEPEYNIRFITQVRGSRLQTQVDFFADIDADAPALTHTLMHFPGKTTALPLSPQHQQNGYRYFLLLKVTPHDQFQIGGPTIAPAGATTAP